MVSLEKSSFLSGWVYCAILLPAHSSAPPPNPHSMLSYRVPGAVQIRQPPSLLGVGLVNSLRCGNWSSPSYHADSQDTHIAHGSAHHLEFHSFSRGSFLPRLRKQGPLHCPFPDAAVLSPSPSPVFHYDTVCSAC